jgi:hypothetical protein
MHLIDIPEIHVVVHIAMARAALRQLRLQPAACWRAQSVCPFVPVAVQHTQACGDDDGGGVDGDNGDLGWDVPGEVRMTEKLYKGVFIRRSVSRLEGLRSDNVGNAETGGDERTPRNLRPSTTYFFDGVQDIPS